jgi:hypothetical protein
MWPANAATGPHHEAREHDGLLHEGDIVAGGDEEAAQERWYHDVKSDVEGLFEAGGHESSTAQRSAHPGNSRFETRSFGKLDSRPAVTIVSALFSTYTMSTLRLLSPSRRLTVSSQHYCVIFTSYCSSHSFTA